MRANEFITEAPLPPKAQQVLWRLKHGLNQPGIQLTPAVKPGPQQPPQADPVPTPAVTTEPIPIAAPRADPADYRAGFVNQSEYLRLQQQIQKLQKIESMFVELERLIDRAQRQPGGIDRGTAADIDIIRDWPLPQTDQDMGEYAAKLRQGIDLMRGYLQRKRAVWR